MVKVAAAICLLCPVSFSASSAVAQQAPKPDYQGLVVEPIRVSLDAVPLGALVTLLMRDVMRVPYLIGSDVLQDRSPVSVRLVIDQGQVPLRVVSFLRTLGLSVELIGGTVVVTRSGSASSLRPPVAGVGLPGVIGPPPASPGPSMGAQPQPARVVARSVALFTPINRNAAELTEVLEAVLPGLDVAAQAALTADGQSLSSRRSSDSIAFSGHPGLVDAALALLEASDTPRPQVSFKLLILEARSNEARGSALQLFSDIFGSALSLNSLGNSPTGPQSLGVSVGGITAVASVIRENGTFRIMSEPTLTVGDGATAVLRAGSQVPTLSSVAVSAQGVPIQSVEYRPAGLSFEISPRVSGSVVAIDLRQERSSFTPTTNGVNASPSLDETSISSSFVLPLGRPIVFAGLVEASDSEVRKGLIPGLLGSKERSESKRDVLIVLEVTAIETIDNDRVRVKPVVIGPFDDASAGQANGP